MTANRVRVLHLGNPTGLYGAERWILALLRYLPTTEIESFVGVVQDAPGQQPALCEHAARLGISTHVFESHGRLSLSSIGEMRAFIREQGIDIVHTHGYKTGALGLLATRGTDCRIVATPHGWNTNAGFKLRTYEALERFLFRFCDAVVPLSQDLYDGLATNAAVRARLHLIRNGVDLSDVDTMTQATAKRHGGDEFIVGYIGQLIARKRIDTLIRAFARVHIPGKKLWLVGEGGQRGELEQLAAQLGEQERVRFFGYRNDRIALLKAFDVFVLASELEGIPRCLLESMAAGVPVVATDIPGCRALIDDGATGRLFALGDAERLAALLTELHADPTARAALASAGRTLVRREFSAENMALRYTELYRYLAPARSGAAAYPGTSPAK